MVDSENIIRAVKKYRAIWDLDDLGYHNKALKDEAWNSVSLDLIPDWMLISYGEKYMRQMEIKKRWNNIRDYYKKLVAEKMPGEPVRSKKRRYLYSDILDFMRPVYDKRRPELEVPSSSEPKNLEKWLSDNATSNDVSEDTETISFLRNVNKIPNRSNVMIKPVSQLRRVNRPISKAKRLSSQMTAFERSIVKHLEKSTTQEDDPDLSFLKSLLPDMQKLTSSQKFDFKLGIMELYRNISNGGDLPDIHHDHDYDHLSEDQIKVETVRLDDDGVSCVS